MTARPHAIPQRPQIPELPLARARMRDVPAWSGTVAIAIGVVVLLGWLLDANALKSMIPGLPSMKPSTSIVFVLMGVGLVLRTRPLNVPRAERAATLGYGGDALLGTSVYDLTHPDDVASTRAAVTTHFASGDPLVGFQNRCRRGDGSDRWLEWTSRLAPNATITFVVARDITERKRVEARQARLQNLLAIRNETLAEHAIRDPLTGLHNRRYFESEVYRRERRRRRETGDQRVPVSVILFDLDHFGAVNKR